MVKTHRIPAVMAIAALGLGGCLARAAPTQASESEPLAQGAGAKAPADATRPATLPATSRKVIRSAELAIAVTSPATTQTNVSRLVERLGGYIHTAQSEVVAADGGERFTTVTLSLRVPAERLEEALREIKRFGAGDETEKIGSEDVTDEYIDVAARVANQRRLEQQLVGILAQANEVGEALEVHQELNGVRTEIDRLEGRRRFLESESALAKISLSLQPLRTAVTFSTAEVAVELRRAARDSVSVAGAIITFAIRGIGILTPISLLLGLPVLSVFWLLKRRQRKLASALTV